MKQLRSVSARAEEKATRSRTDNPGDPDSRLRAFLDAIIARGRTPHPRRKQERSQKRDQEILRAASRVFARDGIARSRIGDIAAEAGMPVSTIYEYYASKEELAYAVPQATLETFFEEFRESVFAKPTAYERLRTYLLLSADFARRNPDWARVLYLEVWPSILVTESPLRVSFDDYVRIMLFLIGQGEAANEWAAGPDRYETAAILNGSLNQVIITALLYRRPRNLITAAASIVDRTLSLLFQRPKGRTPATTSRAKRKS